MSGTIDFIERTVRCPECRVKFDTNVCVDFNPKLTPNAVSGLAGGFATCPECGTVITDDNVEYVEDCTNAYSVTLSIITRVLASNEDEAEDNAVENITYNPGGYITHCNVESVAIDTECPYESLSDNNKPPVLVGEESRLVLKKILDWYSENTEDARLFLKKNAVCGLHKEDNAFIAFDNRGGDCFVEEFRTANGAWKYLNTGDGVDDIWEEEQKSLRGKNE